MLLRGLGVEKDVAGAARRVKVAAVDGFLRAQVLLAGLYQDGEGRPKDDERARRLYIVAAAAGNVEAIATLGSIDDSARASRRATRGRRSIICAPPRSVMLSRRTTSAISIASCA
jgi:TPR repeat protein